MSIPVAGGKGLDGRPSIVLTVTGAGSVAGCGFAGLCGPDG